jgi:hypothetical protein
MKVVREAWPELDVRNMRPVFPDLGQVDLGDLPRSLWRNLGEQKGMQSAEWGTMQESAVRQIVYLLQIDAPGLELRDISLWILTTYCTPGVLEKHHLPNPAIFAHSCLFFPAYPTFSRVNVGNQNRYSPPRSHQA